MQRENDPAVAEGEDGPLLRGTQRVMMHTCSPDMASGLARQGVIDSTDENLRTERQQKPEDAVTEMVKVPAGLTEEAVKGAEVFESVQLSGLDDAGERTAAGAENPGTDQCLEGGEAGLGKAGLKGEQKGRKGTDQQIGHATAPYLSSHINER
jgi:hypothetical protein